MRMESLRVAQHQSLTDKDTLEGTQKIQMGDIDRAPFLRKDKTKLTHGSTPLLPHNWHRSRCTECGSLA